MEDVLTEDQSHYEISLTAGQAFMAFVLLLLSLAAAFAFGLVIGKGQADERLFARKEPAVINEPIVAPKRTLANPVEIARDDFKATISETSAPPPAVAPAPATAAIAAPPPAVADHTPSYAQLLSSSDQKAAEALAEKLIGAGFTAAYVERSTTEKGPMFRVRIRFPSETEARAAEPKLKEFSKEVWITK